MRWHLSASLLLHAALLAAFLFLQPAAITPPPQEEPVHVEIVSGNHALQSSSVSIQLRPSIKERTEPSALTANTIIAAARAHPAQSASPGDETAKEPAGRLIAATRLYSAAVLADRHNRSAREAMKSLASDERMIQLCDLEAMEQIKRAQSALRPDYVIAYAMGDPKLAGHEIDADGAAFLSHRNWYGLKFRCDVSADDSRVVTFAFLVDRPIPKSLWAAHSLTSDAGSAD